MTFAKAILTAVNAAQVGIRVNTDEIEDSLSVIKRACEKRAWNLTVWDAVRGRRRGYLIGAENQKEAAVAMIAKKAREKASNSTELDEDGLDENAREHRKQLDKATPLMKTLVDFFVAPVQLIEAATGIPKEDVGTPNPSLLVIKNAHLAFSQQRMHVSTVIQHIISAGKDQGKFLILMMPMDAELPEEVKPLFHVINFELPTHEELLAVLRGIQISDDRNENETPEIFNEAARAAAGLTRLQAEGIFASSMVTVGKICPKYIWDQKAAILNEEKLIELTDTTLTFENIGGMHGIKSFLRKLCSPSALSAVDAEVRPKGVAAVGPPGVGKSLLAYCLGNELGIKAVKANPGNLMDKFVGNTEKNVRRFFQVIKQLAPCIVIMDEAGQVMPNGRNDSSEVAKRMLGSFLTQMNDMKERVFWFFTANDLTTLHEAFLRAERIDAKIYVRLPDTNQRADIWKMYLKQFFPEKIGDQLNPLHICPDIPKVLAAHVKAKSRKAHNTKDTGEKIAAALLTYHKERRQEMLDAINTADPELHAIVNANTFDDTGWTPAEIKSCCRVACLLQDSIFETSHKTAHVCMGNNGAEILNRLDTWAENEGALDAETGRLFQMRANLAKPVTLPSEFDPTIGEKKQRIVRRSN